MKRQGSIWALSWAREMACWLAQKRFVGWVESDVEKMVGDAGRVGVLNLEILDGLLVGRVSQAGRVCVT